MLVEWLVAILMVGGASWILIGTAGLLRFPDLFNRLHATGMSGTLGIFLVLLGVTVHFAVSQGSGYRLLAAIVLLFLTGPAATHLLIRSAYLGGVRCWEGTLRDDLSQAPHLRQLSRKGAE